MLRGGDGRDQDLGFADFAERCQCYGEVEIQEEPTLQPSTEEPTSSSYPSSESVSESPLHSSVPSLSPTLQPSPAPPRCSVTLRGPSCILVDERRRQFEAVVFFLDHT